MSLSGPSRQPASGVVKSLVVFLHGYGADGADLIGLAPHLSPVLPDTLFVSPNAPEPCAVNPMGRQWFPIPWIDGSPESAMEEGFRAASATLDAWLAGEMERNGLDDGSVALVGFSQGTMMSLSAARRREKPLAGVVGFSGRLLEEKTAPRATPPVLLVHGDSDDVIPVAALEEARAGLAGSGHDVSWHVSRGVGHGIGPDGLALARDFLAERLN